MGKKKKHYQPPPQASVKKTTRTEQERCYMAARKVLRHYGLEPELIDTFTKKQKQALLAVCFGPPVVKPERERTVPRPYIRKIHEEMYRYMKNNFWGDPANQITYLELSVYGMSFIINMLVSSEKKTFHGTPQEETAMRICAKLDEEDDFFLSAFNEVFDQVWHLTRSYSKFNFRLYGFKHDCDKIPLAKGGTWMKMTIILTAQDCRTKVFTHNGIERKAFRVLVTDDAMYEATEIVVGRSEIFPDTKKDGMLDVYIQSHVLHRFTERMNVFDPSTRNLILQYAFTIGIRLVTVEKRILFACSLQDDMPAGYFTFFVQGDDLVINTFLPLVSEKTPEGKKLHEILALTKEETVYLGMDKISFFLKVDFEQIPVLKQALIDSDIWPTKLTLDGVHDMGEEKLIDPNKTMFVKNYFEKRENYEIMKS